MNAPIGVGWEAMGHDRREKEAPGAVKARRKVVGLLREAGLACDQDLDRLGRALWALAAAVEADELGDAEVRRALAALERYGRKPAKDGHPWIVEPPSKHEAYAAAIDDARRLRSETTEVVVRYLGGRISSLLRSLQLPDADEPAKYEPRWQARMERLRAPIWDADAIVREALRAGGASEELIESLENTWDTYRRQRESKAT